MTARRLTAMLASLAFVLVPGSSADGGEPDAAEPAPADQPEATDAGAPEAASNETSAPADEGTPDGPSATESPENGTDPPEEPTNDTAVGADSGKAANPGDEPRAALDNQTAEAPRENETDHAEESDNDTAADADSEKAANGDEPQAGLDNQNATAPAPAPSNPTNSSAGTMTTVEEEPAPDDGAGPTPVGNATHVEARENTTKVVAKAEKMDSEPPGDNHNSSTPSSGPAANASVLPGEGPQGATGAVADLQVLREDSGNRLSWPPAPADAVEIHVWRREERGWIQLAELPADAGTLLDTGAPTNAAYRLTWTTNPAIVALPGEGPLTTFAPSPHGTLGAWLLALLWGGIAMLATVRAAATPVRLEGANDRRSLTAILGLPGIDPGHVQQVHALGVQTLGQLRLLDADALAFWTGLSASEVRTWQASIELVGRPVAPIVPLVPPLVLPEASLAGEVAPRLSLFRRADGAGLVGARAADAEPQAHPTA